VPVDGQTALAQANYGPRRWHPGAVGFACRKWGASRQAKARQSDREQGCRQTLHCAVSLTQETELREIARWCAPDRLSAGGVHET
jgi:hypothetical protein